VKRLTCAKEKVTLSTDNDFVRLGVWPPCAAVLSQMRVDLIQRYPTPGGFSVETYFARLLEVFPEFGIDAALHTVPFPSRGLLPRLRAVHYVRRFRDGIVHITGDIHFAALGLDPRRTVVTVLDCGTLHRLRGVTREIFRQAWFYWPLQHVAAITVISEATKVDLLRWIPTLDPAKIHVVPVAISPLYKQSPKPFDLGTPRILQVGTKYNKNVPRLIRALRDIPCHLVIVGDLDGEMRQLLRDCSISHTNLVDITDDALAVEYQKTDIVAFASTFEGFGMPIVEAQAVGRPVITGNCSSMPEVAGQGAALVDPHDVESIRAAVLRVITDATYRDTLVQEGYANAARFDNRRIAGQYRDIYRTIRITS